MFLCIETDQGPNMKGWRAGFDPRAAIWEPYLGRDFYFLLKLAIIYSHACDALTTILFMLIISHAVLSRSHALWQKNAADIIKCDESKYIL